LDFIARYCARENVTLCFPDLTAAVLIGCASFSDVKTIVHTFIENTSNLIDECLADHINHIVAVANETPSLSLGTLLFEFLTEYDSTLAIDSGVCAVAQSVIDVIDDWDDRTRLSVCAVSGRLSCPAFDALDIDALCPTDK
jgi:hypothetical protein